jgi:hypothetical protein
MNTAIASLLGFVVFPIHYSLFSPLRLSYLSFYIAIGNFLFAEVSSALCSVGRHLTDKKIDGS